MWGFQISKIVLGDSHFQRLRQHDHGTISYSRHQRYQQTLDAPTFTSTNNKPGPRPRIPAAGMGWNSHRQLLATHQ